MAQVTAYTKDGTDAAIAAAIEEIDAGTVGLDNVDNTADLDKPVSNQQAEYIGNVTGVSEDEGNELTTGTDGRPFFALSGHESLVSQTSLASQLKYAVAFCVLEADEDENDIPGDFPQGPLFEGGPPPIVVRKKAVD